MYNATDCAQDPKETSSTFSLCIVTFLNRNLIFSLAVKHLNNYWTRDNHHRKKLIFHFECDDGNMFARIRLDSSMNFSSISIWSFLRGIVSWFPSSSFRHFALKTCWWKIVIWLCFFNREKKFDDLIIEKNLNNQKIYLLLRIPKTLFSNRSKSQSFHEFSSLCITIFSERKGVFYIFGFLFSELSNEWKNE